MEKVFKNEDSPDDPRVQELSNIYRIKFPKSIDVLEVVKEYGNDPNVVYAEPNYIRRIFRTTPNDLDYERQWYLRHISADLGWDYEKGHPSVVIAIIDTGVDWDHPDLRDNIWINVKDPINGFDDDGNGYIDDYYGWDFVSVSQDSVWPGEDPGPRDNNPMDFDGHGTLCAGIASACTNNKRGVVGLTWYCKIMALRAGYKHKDGNSYISDIDSAQAIEYAADNGAHVISMSWGDYRNSNTLRRAIEYAYNRKVIEYAYKKGCVLVAAAGNDDTETKVYPAAYDNVIAVAATDRNDLRSVWSHTLASNYGNWIDVCAPGTDIYSTLFNDTYGFDSGTSTATPLVAGLAALIISRNPNLTNEQVINRIKESADSIDSLNPDYKGLLGSGRINVYKALTLKPPPSPLEPYLANVFSYPNPTYDGKVTIQFVFQEVPRDINICIYDSSGELVHKVERERIKSNGYTYSYLWNGENDMGKKVGSGVYLYKVEVKLNNKKDVATGKIAVIR